MDIEDIRKDAERVRTRRAGLAKLGLAQVDPLFNEAEIEAGYEEYLLIIQALKNVEGKPDVQAKAIEKLKRLSEAKDITLQKALKFAIDVPMGTNKPFYDFTCAFMCQNLNVLKENQQSYYAHFNIDVNDEIVQKHIIIYIQQKYLYISASLCQK